MSNKYVSRRQVIKLSGGLLSGAVLASCAPAPRPESESKAEPTQQMAKAEPTLTAAPAAQEPVKLRWWGGVPEDRGPKQSLEAWNSANPNIQVEYVQYPNNDEGNVKLDVALQAAGEVDVLVSYGLTRLKQRADAGALEPLDEYFNGLDPEKEWGKLDNRWDGKYWALIFNSQPRFVYLNKNALDENGLQVPSDWTWDEYMGYAKKLVKGSGPTKRYGAFYSNENSFEPVTVLKGGDFIYKDECTTNYDDPLFLQALKMRVQMQDVDKSVAPLGDVNAGKLQPYSEFLGGRTAMLIEGSWMLRYISNVKDNPRDFQVFFAPMPHFKDAPNAFRPGNADDRCSIARLSKNKQAAWQFMKWWGTEGYIHMTPFGRMTLWRGRKPEESAKAFLEAFPEYEKYMDEQTYRTVMFSNADKDYPIQFRATAAAEIGQISREELTRVFLGELTPEDALSNLKKRADEALGKVCRA